MSDMAWPIYFKAVFGRDIPADEIPGWDRRIDQAAPNIKAAEVLAAIDAVANDRIKEPSKFPPTVNDLVSAIRKSRWQAKQDQYGPTIGECLLCSHGIVSFGAIYEDGNIAQVVPVGTEHAGQAGTFCRCPEGKKLAAISIEQHRTTPESLERLQGMVFAAIQNQPRETGAHEISEGEEL